LGIDVMVGILYRFGNTYRVYSKFRDALQKKISSEYGTATIKVTPEGKMMLALLYREGRLTMKRGRKPIVGVN